MTVQPPNIPSPDPSLATNERLAHAIEGIEKRIEGNRVEAMRWVEKLQELLEDSIASGNTLLAQKIIGAEDKTTNLDRVVQTRLAGSETALNAAMAAADKVTQEIKLNIGAVLNELKAGIAKQIEGLDEKVDDLKKRVFESGGRTEGGFNVWTTAIACISALAAAAAIVITLTRPTMVVQERPPPAAFHSTALTPRAAWRGRVQAPRCAVHNRPMSSA